MEIILELNKLGGAHGVGRFDCVENRFQAIKTREVYEAPAAKILIRGHEALEDLTLSKDVCQFKEILSRKYAELIYNGLWYGALREGLDRFFESIQAGVSGDVRLRLYKGHASVTGRRSEYSLYDEQQGMSSDNLTAMPVEQVARQAEAKQIANRIAHEESCEQPTHSKKS